MNNNNKTNNKTNNNKMNNNKRSSNKIEALHFSHDSEELNHYLDEDYIHLSMYQV